MSDDKTPDVEEIKERLEIPVEEEPVKAETVSDAGGDIVEELKRLGRQFAETIETAWQGEERQRIETQVREGVKSFVGEVDNVIREARESDPVGKMRSEAVDMKERVETSDFSRKARSGVVQGLGWLSEELSKLADQFAPKEKSPKEAAADAAASDAAATDAADESAA